MARALTAAVARTLLVGVRASESVACRLVFHGAPPWRFVQDGLLQVRGRQLGRWCGVVGKRVEERRPGSVVSRGERGNPAVCPVDREHAPVERRTVAELRDDLAWDGLHEEDPPAVRRIGRWAAGKRLAPGNRIPQIRPDLARHRDRPEVALRWVTDYPCCAGHARVVWITGMGLDRSSHMKVFLER